jgi:predicted NBD/HSP70 family sugar kinase
MGLYVVLDIGGTKCIAASSDAEGRILKKTLRPTPHALQEGLDLLHQMVDEVADGEKIAGIGAALGRTESGRCLSVFFIRKLGNKALIITARDMNTRERRRYEKK